MSYQAVIEAARDNKSLILNHTCFRVKDPSVSVAFYETKFGMKLVSKKEFPDMKFSLYFLTFPGAKAGGEEEINAKGVFGVPGVLELTHNWGTENDPDYKVNDGNEEPHRGFGHICFAVSDIHRTCETLEANGVSFKKRLSDGRQKDIAFALDPDGYWIELVQYAAKSSEDQATRFNHTMIRVKDPVKSLEFYQNVLGMTLLDKSVHENAKFTLYFLGYNQATQGNNNNNRRSLEGLLELTHNWGTETDPDFKYHNGNTQPQGYGHICISCEDPETLCREIEDKYGDKVTWAPKFNQGKMKNLAFIRDPDDYSIEIVPSGLKL